MNEAKFHPVIVCEALSWTDPMGEAVQAGNLETVKSLLKIDPLLISSTDAYGFTPLHWTAIKGWKEIAELLIAEHAVINARDRSDYTPLHYSITGSHPEVRALLRVHGGIE